MWSNFKVVPYSNVDYVLASVWKLLPHTLQRVISYDIACQWSTNFPSRVAALPDHVRFEVPIGNQLHYAIPKFHFRAHKQDAHDIFSLYLMLGVGRMDGEEIERYWARHNQVAYSTREMGPGSRHDTLEDHFGFSNWLKLILLGKWDVFLTSVKSYAKLSLCTRSSIEKAPEKR